MLTFEFKDGQFITFSFETRREIGERYHPWQGLWRAYELYLCSYREMPYISGQMQEVTRSFVPCTNSAW